MEGRHSRRSSEGSWLASVVLLLDHEEHEILSPEPRASRSHNRYQSRRFFGGICIQIFPYRHEPGGSAWTWKTWLERLYTCRGCCWWWPGSDDSQNDWRLPSLCRVEYRRTSALQRRDVAADEHHKGWTRWQEGRERRSTVPYLGGLERDKKTWWSLHRENEELTFSQICSANCVTEFCCSAVQSYCTTL